MKKYLHILSALVLTTSVSAYAQSEEEASSGEWGFSGYIGVASLDSDRAAEEGVEDSAFAIGVLADYRQNNWVTSIGIEGLLYDDNNEFTQTVVGTGIGNSGDRSTASSEAQAVMLSIASGYEWRFGEEGNGALSLQGGFSAMVQSDRSIANCSDCLSEDIDLDSGAFVKGGVHHVGESWTVGLVLQQYVSGDIGTTIGLQFGSAF